MQHSQITDRPVAPTGRDARTLCRQMNKKDAEHLQPTARSESLRRLGENLGDEFSSIKVHSHQDDTPTEKQNAANKLHSAWTYPRSQ